MKDAAQAAEAEMYRVNRERQDAAVEWQRERHGLEGKLAAAEHRAKSAIEERDRAQRDAASLERELREERNANQDLVGRLNAYAREMAERDREHQMRRTQELRDAEAGIHQVYCGCCSD